MRARWWAAFLLAMVSLGCSGGTSNEGDLDLDVQTFPDMGAGLHMAEAEVQRILNGEIAPPTYNSDPPTSGPHATKAAACGIFREPVPDVYQVHNLEFGVVVIQYAPSLEAVDIESLERLARGLGDRFILAPRPGLDSPVVATAWTAMMVLDGIDREKLRAFYDAYVGKGPEVLECPLEVDEGA